MSRFTQAFLIVLAVFLLIGAAFTAIVDPYSMFRAPRIEGFNYYKPTAINFVRAVKPYHVSLRDYDVIITGTSRIGLGMRCRHFLEQGRSCYNAAAPVAPLYESLVALQQRPDNYDTALISLELLTFMTEAQGHEKFVEERHLRLSDGSLNRHFPSQFVNDIAALLWSEQSLRASRTTYRLRNAKSVFRRQGGMLYMTAWGEWGYDRRTIAPLGPAVEAKRQAQRFYYTLTVMRNEHQARTANMDETRSNMAKQLAAFETILELGYSRGLDLRFFVPMSHMDYWTLQEHLGFQQTLQNWKRDLVARNEALARTHGMPPYPIYDFSGVNRFSETPAPQAEPPGGFNRHFYDAVHFDSLVGDRMIKRILQDCGNFKQNNFGPCLRSSELDALLSRQGMRRKAYREENAEHIREMIALVMENQINPPESGRRARD